MKMKESLFGKTPDELIQIAVENNLPRFTGKQVADWLYKKDTPSIEAMTNLSKKARGILSEKYNIGLIAPTKVQESTDGTKKYLFATGNGNFIETAMIPEKDRVTVCVSSQVGCKMGCLFCMTAKQGFTGQLTAGEIVNQVKSIREANKVTNIVYMGMGEPFDNLGEVLKSIEIFTAEWGFAMSPKRITVSSIGIIPGMLSFLEESNAHLAISLHTPFDEERQRLMPVQSTYPIREVIKEIRNRQFGRQRKVSFEYILFKGLNDTPLHVKELARLLNGLKCRLNLIRFHPIPGTPLRGSDDATLFEFKDMLNGKGIFTTIRGSRGQDIYAACGLLSTKNMEGGRHN
ncbi:23S rRNA (adenine(2503)-C(2))-methyltransferase @ tRNA (adenine(37)-C(2))-methyltransferase [hydrothermal vent metagenome]|uniref:23S rRNA (Adenine(2503)-C(2))-methyltransferase @ tRNA (Adenine(37)-C(2))-methyltransferase n=1 Tax=hydrothermal vent metagenome TaxID=652676 RepID=A0A3B0UVB3_9ZZZZ